VDFAALRIASFALVLLLIGADVRPASAAAVPLVRLDPIASADVAAHCYRVRRASADAALLIVLRGDVTDATLRVDGRLERVGRRVATGPAPLGHGLPAFAVPARAALGPLCIAGRDVRIAAALDDDLVREAISVGRIGGFYLGIFAAISMLAVGLVSVSFDSASLFYLIFTLTFLGFGALRQGFAPFAGRIDPEQTFLALNLVTAFGACAFFIEFLGLRAASRKLFWLVALSIGSESAIGAIFAVVPALTPALSDATLILNIVGTTLLITVAIIRGRAGYRPAYYLLAGLSGLMLANWYLGLRDLLAFSTPLIDRWAFELGTATDAIFFSVALAYRMRYNLAANARMKRQLERETFAAEHDQLTGLANRRGLERWLAASPTATRTLFFIDLDNFKMVNDDAGHEAGDQTLLAVAHILDRIARPGDIAARLGGDEFVLILAAMPSARLDALIGEIEASVAALRPLGEADARRIGASIGTALLAGSSDFKAALDAADAQAYERKREHHRAAGRAADPATSAS
jgi:diguanylate cyclase (GGDEF)-like protein